MSSVWPERRSRLFVWILPTRFSVEGFGTFAANAVDREESGSLTVY
jgi:hypothetical protein